MLLVLSGTMLMAQLTLGGRVDLPPSFYTSSDSHEHPPPSGDSHGSYAHKTPYFSKASHALEYPAPPSPDYPAYPQYPSPDELVMLLPSQTARPGYVPHAVKELRHMYRMLRDQYPNIPLLGGNELYPGLPSSQEPAPYDPDSRMGRQDMTLDPEYIISAIRNNPTVAKTLTRAYAGLQAAIPNLQVPVYAKGSTVYPSGVEPCGNNDGVCVNTTAVEGGVKLESVTPCSTPRMECRKFVYENQNTTQQSIVFFQSSKFPLARRDILSSSLTIKIRNDVNQILVELEEFLLPYSNGGSCWKDYVEIVSSSKPNGVFGPGNSKLCGLNANQHFYLDVRPGDLLVLRAVVTGLQLAGGAGTSSYLDTPDYRFSIKISQIQAKVEAEAGPILYYKRIRAPLDCLQYYTADRGVVANFNYDGKTEYPINLHYSICIKSAESPCGVQVRAMKFNLVDLREECADGSGAVAKGLLCCQEPESDFLSQILPEIRLIDLEEATYGNSTTQGVRQPVKYIGIDGLSDGSGLKGYNYEPNQIRYFFCGKKLGRTGMIITQKRGPVVFQVVSNDVPTPTGAGFKLHYTAISC